MLETVDALCWLHSVVELQGRCYFSYTVMSPGSGSCCWCSGGGHCPVRLGKADALQTKLVRAALSHQQFRITDAGHITRSSYQSGWQKGCRWAIGQVNTEGKPGTL